MGERKKRAARDPEAGESAMAEKRRRVAEAARAVFLKYGYRRVTMQDLAQAAGMSRPALYLLFSKKEDIFREVVRNWAEEAARGVSRGLPGIKQPVDRLKFVCELWMVRPFDWISQSEEAREIYEGVHEFARDAMEEAMRRFERDLATVLEELPKGALPKGIRTAQAAHLLAASIGGIKHACRNSVELREKTAALLAMTVR